MSQILSLSIAELTKQVRSGALSAEEVTRASLDSLHTQASLGAYLSVQADAALETARAIDARRLRGEALGPLVGVPIGIKDALCTRGAPTTCASKILTRGEERFVPVYDATTVARLRAADAVLVGKCNMDEFAMGSSNENSAFGPVRNPFDPTRASGGSSGGSAVSVAAQMTLGSLGSDTGGSIRQPASFTGVVGVKPTYGRVSRYGLVAFASSLDQVGPFARDVRGAARLLGILAGHDPHDATTHDSPVDDYEAACGRDIRGLRIGIPDEYFGEGLAPEVASSIHGAMDKLRAQGAEIIPVKLPHTKYAISTYYILATAEASSNLARFDGVRFGLRVERPRADLQTMYESTRGEGFGREVQRRILLGTYVLSAGYYDAYYLKAQRVRTLILRDFERAFQQVDAIAAPTTPTVAFRLGEKLADPLQMYLSDIYTLPASLAGIPAITVPVAKASATSDHPELPVGLQLMGPHLSEARLFQLASAVEGGLPSQEESDAHITVKVMSGPPVPGLPGPAREAGLFG